LLSFIIDVNVDSKKYS